MLGCKTVVEMDNDSIPIEGGVCNVIDVASKIMSGESVQQLVCMYTPTTYPQRMEVIYISSICAVCQNEVKKKL